MESNNPMKFARYPDTYYYGIQPMISSVVADMDDMSISYPTQEMYENILTKVYDDAGRMYPEEFETLNSQEANEQFSPVFRRRRLLRDLLGILVLSELLRRRRHRRW